MITVIYDLDPRLLNELIASSHPEADNPVSDSMEADTLARNLVGERQSKIELVGLVRWLLLEGQKHADKVKQLKRRVDRLELEIDPS